MTKPEAIITQDIAEELRDCFLDYEEYFDERDDAGISLLVREAIATAFFFGMTDPGNLNNKNMDENARKQTFDEVSYEIQPSYDLGVQLIDDLLEELVSNKDLDEQSQNDVRALRSKFREAIERSYNAVGLAPPLPYPNRERRGRVPMSDRVRNCSVTPNVTPVLSPELCNKIGGFELNFYEQTDPKIKENILVLDAAIAILVGADAKQLSEPTSENKREIDTAVENLLNSLSGLADATKPPPHLLENRHEASTQIDTDGLSHRAEHLQQHVDSPLEEVKTALVEQYKAHGATPPSILESGLAR